MSLAQLCEPQPGLRTNIVDYLLEHSAAPEHASRPYIIAPDRSWSFGDLSERVGRIGNLLKSLDVKPGDRVLFSAMDGVDFPAVMLGIMKIGAVALPINTYLKPHDYQYFIADSDAQVVILDHGLIPTIEQIRPALPRLRHIITLRGPADGYPLLDDLIVTQSAQCASYPTDPNAMAFWLYSSGSTGQPKGVVHTGNHMFWATELFGLGALEITKDDIILSPPKMYFAFGLGNQVYFPIRSGAQVVVNPDAITPQRVWELWLKHEPTAVFGVPTLFAGMLRYAEEHIGQERVRAASTRLRLCISGGEILPPTLMRRWRDYVGVDILDGFGTTEMTHMFLINRPGQPVPGSCGRLVAGYSAEVVDDEGRPVPKGEIGNLRMFGPSAAREYWNKPEHTALTMAKGGVLTGDKVFEDEDGNFFMVGRADDMLRVGGIWVSPAEVEGVIAQHANVLECAVIGTPDEDNMIKPKAFVVPRAPVADNAAFVADLRAFVRERLAHVKCPRWFAVVQELPKTSTGKIQRFRLRAGEGGAAPA
ncbi:benzoate-CoA ligase family protein [Pseudorhodoplanes sinuspersici]|nr:benzoate-CoA ligase family protein [Pseudorhodoplanes sinuspersici]RKE68026.1 4-hydroxybenzoate-CoA ligase/benzoate-CoA ligase [Pseudorhodoplanes sinuspersici]